MPWAAAAAVAGAAISADASSSASNAQQDAANNASGLQGAQFAQTRNDNAPFLMNGTAGNNRLAYLLGLSTIPGIPGQNLDAPSRQAIFSGYEQELSKNGIDVPYSRLTAADKAGRDATVDRLYNEAMQKYEASQAPIATQDSNYGSLLRKFTANDLNNDPVYQSGLQFGMDEGVKGLTRQAAATGTQLSGATLKALTRYANDYGTTKAEGAYNRYNTDQTNQFNRLAGISGSGQTASNLVSSAGQNMANNVGQNIIGAGNARGASYIAGANSVNNAIGTGVNAYQQKKLMSSMYPQNSMSGYSEPAGGYYPYGGSNLDIGNMS